MLHRVKCLFGIHAYYPSYTTRQWRSVRGAHCYHEFQMSCSRCKKKTNWIRLGRLDAFTKSLGKRYGWDSN
ncbi:hypothetical protein NVP1091O_22 [Vibrio phage 1.091.O._10N.286.52.B12]|nr:hypothetical protein NVP1091O_22 [Vibrio phage 1.091.O._10N.286.52.B12]